MATDAAAASTHAASRICGMWFRGHRTLNVIKATAPAQETTVPASSAKNMR